MKLKTLRLTLATTVAVMAFSTALPRVSLAEDRITDIKVVGSERIEPQTVLTYLDVRPGDPLTQETMDKALKSLFRTGLFADVSIDHQGGVMQVNVTENPIINRIAFEGNDEIKNEELQAEIQLHPRQVLTRTKVQADVNRLSQIYRRKGLFSADIEPKIIKLDQNRVDLVFEIKEGAVTKVESIRFVGNRRFDDDKLRSEVSTKETHWYSFISSNDRYDPDRLSYDQELLRRFYLSQGYADFELKSAVAELSQDRKNFYITFTLQEGSRYKVSSVRIESQLRNFDASVLNQYLTVEAGDWYDAEDVQSTVDKLTAALGDRQYAFVAVQPKIDRDKDKHTLGIVFQIKETPRVYVERVDVHGNVRTLDKVIRREMKLVEGDPFNRSKLAKSEQDIRDLDFFEKVDVKTLPGSAPDKTVIDVGVEEKSTGELSVGAGFSTADGPLADFGIHERNFLGKGQDLDFSTTIAGQRTEFDASFTEPYFLDRDLQAGVDLFHSTRDLQDEASYDQKRTGGGLRLGYPLSEKWRQNLRYTLERNDIENVQGNASLYIREQEGERVTSAVSQRITYDDRDSTLYPTNGLMGWFDTEVAGVGGDARYVSGKLGATYYYPIMDDWIFNVLGEAGAITGYADENVAISDRFYLGGSTLRGFKEAGIGPRDAATEDALGGNLFYRGTVETSFPLGLPDELGVKGYAFSDFGSLWDVDASGPGVIDQPSLRLSTGVGVSWRSPMGPIRVDLGYPLLKENYDKEENFRFSFGTRF